MIPTCSKEAIYKLTQPILTLSSLLTYAGSRFPIGKKGGPRRCSSSKVGTKITQELLEILEKFNRKYFWIS